MRILILHMRYSPDITGTGPLVTQLAESLAAAGDHVTVITGKPHYGRKRSAEYAGLPFHRSDEAGVQVWRCAGFPYLSHTVPGRILDYAINGLLTLWAGFVAGAFDVMMVMTPPITTALAGVVIGWLKRRPMVLYLQDIWPDGLVQMGKIRRGPLLQFLLWIENLSYARAKRIIALSEGMKSNLSGKGVEPDLIGVVRNWADLSGVRPDGDGRRFRMEHGLGESFIVLFSGNLGFASNLGMVLKAAGMLRADTQIHMVLAGDGSAKSSLQSKSEHLGLTNLSFVSPQPAAQFPDMLAAADLTLVTLRRGMGQLSVPSKVLAYMAAGRPILAAVPDDSDVRGMLRDSGAGWAIEPDSAEALAAGIRSAIGRSAELPEMGRRGRQFAETHFQRRTAVGKVRELLAAAAGTHGAAEPSQGSAA